MRQAENPANPLQLNVSPIRNWRALEVFLYLWWQKAEINPLYDKGLERIGCYLCPAMLESEYEELRIIHPSTRDAGMHSSKHGLIKKVFRSLFVRGGSGAGGHYPRK